MPRTAHDNPAQHGIQNEPAPDRPARFVLREVSPMTTLSKNASGEVHLVLRGEAENRILATLRHWPYWLRVNVERDPEDSARCLSVTLNADQLHEPIVRDILKRSFGMTFPD